MYRFKKRFDQKGYTLIEVAMATVVLGVMATTLVLSNRLLNKEEVKNADQTFATQKAIQMYEELRSLVNGNQQLGVGVLDNYSNNSRYDLCLTTDVNVDNASVTASTAVIDAAAGNVLSGNMKTSGIWRYMRQVEINRVANDIYARQVTVKVFLYPGNSYDETNPQPGPLLATVGGVLRTSETPYEPSQVMDLYILQITTIPAWWAVLPTLSQAMQTSIYDLEGRTPGLVIRPHFITRSSYGRDTYYQPYTNSVAHPAETTTFPWAYFYPGYAMQDATACNCDAQYYDPDNDQNSLQMAGQVLLDGTSDPVYSSQFDTSSGVNYTIADQYNNAMRYPDEIAAYNAVTEAYAAAATIKDSGVTEISYRMLLEGMLSQPQSFENSIIVNLHGELLPLPPIRNYSDPAKDPGNQLVDLLGGSNPYAQSVSCNIANWTTSGSPSIAVTGGNTNVRVVTHPELLYYPGATTSSSSVTIRLRVYAYYDTEDTGGQFPPTNDPRVPAISLFFPDASVTVQAVTAIIGNNINLNYAYASPTGPYPSGYLGAVPGDTNPVADGGPMSFGFQYTGPGNAQSLITLYNTPLRNGQQVVAGLTPGMVGGGGQQAEMAQEQSKELSPEEMSGNNPQPTNTPTPSSAGGLSPQFQSQLTGAQETETQNTNLTNTAIANKTGTQAGTSTAQQNATNTAIANKTGTQAGTSTAIANETATQAAISTSQEQQTQTQAGTSTAQQQQTQTQAGTSTAQWKQTQTAIRTATQAGTSTAQANRTNTAIAAQSFTPTPTISPTGTPTLSPQAGGLNQADMLYGAEYVPCSPDQTQGALTSANYLAAYNSPSAYQFTNSDLTSIHYGPQHPKNTARWIIVLTMPVTQQFGSPVTIYSGYIPTNGTVIGTHAIETRLGFGVTCSNFVSSSNVTFSMPTNLSRTYVWCGDATMPPYTEQYQFLGDPRDCPYLDNKVGGVSIAGAAVTIQPNSYNWWFKNGAATSGNTGMNIDGYTGFNASGNNQSWGGNSNINIDLPRFYQLIRQGLMQTTSIWVTTNGYSFYYYGLGGEIGFDHAPFSTGVSILDYPFIKSGSAVANGYDSINGDGKTANAITGLWAISNVTGNSAVTWYNRPWLGELYPDKMYSVWSSYGNLPTIKPVSSMPESFYCEALQNVAIPVTCKSNDGFANLTYYPNVGPNGCTAFFNGETSSGAVFQHNGGASGTGTEQNLAVTTYNIYPYALPYIVSVQRPWYFGGSGSSPEWNLDPYDYTWMRTSLDLPSTETDNASVSSRIYYNYSGSTTQYGSGVVRMTVWDQTGHERVGYVVETGTSPSANVGFAALAETSLVYGLRAFNDGGEIENPTSTGHIAQIPLISIYPVSSVPEYDESQTVAVTISSAVTYTANPSGETIVGEPVTDIWWRFMGEGSFPNYYTEEYPGYGNGTNNMPTSVLPSNLYTESAVSVVYNLKYCSTSDYVWHFVQDGTYSDCVSGVYNPNYSLGGVAPITYSLPVTGGPVTLTEGSYLLMAEAYRLGFGEHYAYDIYQFNVSW